MTAATVRRASVVQRSDAAPVAAAILQLLKSPLLEVSSVTGLAFKLRNLWNYCC